MNRLQKGLLGFAGGALLGVGAGTPLVFSVRSDMEQQTEERNATAEAHCIEKLAGTAAATQQVQIEKCSSPTGNERDLSSPTEVVILISIITILGAELSRRGVLAADDYIQRHHQPAA